LRCTASEAFEEMLGLGMGSVGVLTRHVLTNAATGVVEGLRFDKRGYLGVRGLSQKVRVLGDSVGSWISFQVKVAWSSGCLV